MSMSIGDRVLVDGSKLGTITSIDEESAVPYLVGFMDGDWEVCCEGRVKLVAQTNYKFVM